MKHWKKRDLSTRHKIKELKYSIPVSHKQKNN